MLVQEAHLVHTHLLPRLTRPYTTKGTWFRYQELASQTPLSLQSLQANLARLIPLQRLQILMEHITCFSQFRSLMRLKLACICYKSFAKQDHFNLHPVLVPFLVKPGLDLVWLCIQNKFWYYLTGILLPMILSQVL